METLKYWLKGIRFYIAVGSILTTALVVLWAHAAYQGTSLYPSRVEEVFAWLATGLIALALSIGSTYKLFPNLAGKSVLFDARRLIGVSATWFAMLHVVIAYRAQFKGANPFSLPSMYQRSFLVGSVAMLILLAMTFTSFDAAFNKLGVWWFRLHRLVYVAAVLILFHTFLTGVHATQPLAISLLAAVSVFIIGAHALVTKRRPTVSVLQVGTLIVISVMVLTALAYGVHQHDSQKRLASYGVQK